LRRHRRHGLRTLQGGAIIGALVALATTIFLLDDIIARLRSPYDLVAVLPEAPRLAAGSRVWVAGNDVGVIRSVALLPARADGTPRVAIGLQLPGRVRDQVRQDSHVRITAVNQMGAPVIDITPGSGRAARLAPGDTLRAVSRVDRGVVLARAARFRASLDSAAVEMRALQGPAARRLAGLEQAGRQLAAAGLAYRALQRDLEASTLFDGLSSGELSALLAHGGAQLGTMLTVMQQVSERARDSGLSGNAAALSARAASLQRSLSELHAALREQGGTADRLARDSALVKALTAARAELDSLLADARRNPLRYVF
jgi:ABC-type transporter Mla subunit MlaD